MITPSFLEGINLLRKWGEERRWVGVKAVFSEAEQYTLWAKIEEVSTEQFTLAGENAIIYVPISEASSVFGYGDEREIPESFHKKMTGGVEFCFTILSKAVIALLFGGKDAPV